MNVLIVDDHPLARLGISSIVSKTERVNEIHEASNLKEALDKLDKNKINVAFIDLKLGAEDGLEAAIQGKIKSSETKFIVITSFITQDDFLRAEKYGIDGYILKEAAPADINFVLDSVVRGKKYYDPGIIMNINKSSNKQILLNQLTGREKEVLIEIGNGLSNNEISSRLYVSENTIKKHISSILLKLNLKHRTQAALYIKNML
ncbi:MAG: response regulator [Ignavibacteriales bacterium]